VNSSVAIIPARKGSVSFPNKNMAVVQGKTLIEHAVETARESGIFDFIIVTTDYTSGEITFRLKPNEILHTRSEFSASSSANASDVLRDFIDCIECEGVLRDSLVCYLQPTSPLRTSGDIVKSRVIADTSHFIRCLSVNSKPIAPDKLMSFNHDLGSLSEVRAGLASSNRQENCSYYLPNGAIYWFKYMDFLEEDYFPLEGAAPYFMSELSSIDIDRPEDLVQVQMIMEATHG
jgi:N-acylneuraminate cytidylyltransferase/CMP-N,N'-diacetyllegionaminic acid synthase